MRVIWVLEEIEKTLYGFCKDFMGLQEILTRVYLGCSMATLGNIWGPWL